MQRATDLPAGFADLRGQTFKDRYEITELVDTGTRRVLFAGRELETGRAILLRVLRPLALHDEATVTRFGKRMVAAGRVRHAVLHGPLDSGEVFDGTFWASYERPAGMPLLDAVASAGGRFAWPEARALLLELVQGLRAAHASRVVHGALHPSSCWIDRPAGGAACSLRLIDLAATSDPNLEDASLESSRTINLGGDAVFIAPESVGVSVGDQRSDAYLAGLLAYLLLTGHPPFEGGNAFKVMAMHMQSAVPPMREHGADVPPAAEALVQALLAKEPDQRPDGMARVEQMLLGLDDEGQPQAVPGDEAAQGGGRRGRGRAKRGQGTDGPALETARSAAIANAAAPAPSTPSSFHRMLPGQEILAPAQPGAPRPAQASYVADPVATSQPATPPHAVTPPTPVATPFPTPTPTPSAPLPVGQGNARALLDAPLPADGGTLLLSGSSPSLLETPLPADGGTLLLSGHASSPLEAPLPADGGTLLLSGHASSPLEAPLPADGGTLLLSGHAASPPTTNASGPAPADGGTLLLRGNASASFDSTMRLAGGSSSGKGGAAPDATVMLTGGGANEPLAGTMRLPGLDEPQGSEPAGSTVALSMPAGDPSHRGTDVVTRTSAPTRSDARSTAVAPRSTAAETARASASTAGTKVAPKPSASTSMQRTSQTTLQQANRGGGSPVLLIVLAVIAVAAGVAVGLLM